MNSIIINNLEHIKLLCDIHNVKQLYAFGSVCTENFNESSDVDLIVEFKNENYYPDYANNYFSFTDKLENLFDRKVDLVAAKTLKNPYFINEINKSRALIYG